MSLQVQAVSRGKHAGQWAVFYTVRGLRKARREARYFDTEGEAITCRDRMERRFNGTGVLASAVVCSNFSFTNLLGG